MPREDLYREILDKLDSQEPHVGSLYLNSVRVGNLDCTREAIKRLGQFIELENNRLRTRADHLVRVIWNVDNWIVTLPFWYTTLRTREHDDITLAEVEVYTPNVYAQRGNMRFQLLPESDSLIELCLGSDLRVVPAGLLAEMHRTLDVAA